jgi:tRNA-2-methylthio-N6-dimethylallyladenosine synthase
MKNYFIKIFGCQMNHSDAERISAYLEKLGLEPAFKNGTGSPAKALASAGLIVFVTCGVRQSAEDRIYGQVNNIRKKFPKKKIILTGCLAHREDVQRRLKNKVDIFTTIKDFSAEIVSSIKYQASSINRKSKIHNTSYSIHNTKKPPCNNYLKIIPKYTNPYTAHVPIMTGCNNFCAYCVVPYARGREYSRPAEDILKEAGGLVKKGCREIILLGQNVNSYRSGKINFPKLLRLIEKIPGKFWVAFLTSHPKDMSDELIGAIAESKKICEYVSLPAQAGDNEILRRMNRKYTIAHYKNLIKKIRATFLRYELRKVRNTNLGKLSPAISADIIVGFPGEGNIQFENTAKLMREMKFDMAYISQYSPRPETAAWGMKDDVSKKEKVRREKVLTKILEETALMNNKKYIGKVVEVLADAGGRGHTRTQKKVVFRSDKKTPVGEFAKVKITKVKAFGLEGEII